MSKKLKLKDGYYCGHLNSWDGDRLLKKYRVEVEVINGHFFLFEDTPSERVGVGEDETPKPNDGQINWLFVFGVGFLAIAAFHLFVK